MALVALSVAVSLLALFSPCTSTTLEVQLLSESGFYVVVDGTPWLKSGPTGVQSGGLYSSSDAATLTASSVRSVSGRDAFGAWTGQSTSWRTRDANEFVTTLRWYPAVAGVAGALPFAVFRAEYPLGATNATSTTGQLPTNNDISAVFPSFMVPTSSNLGWFTYGGNMGWETKAGRFQTGVTIPGGLTAGLPLIMLDEAATAAIVISPFSNFFSTSQATITGSFGSAIGIGPMGSTIDVPVGYAYETIIYAAPSVNSAMEGWGAVMRQRFGKDGAMRERDFTLNYLGYWTDAGACYWYNPGETGVYEETLVQVQKSAAKQAIPLRYVQLDSWFYPKGPSNGMLNWTAIETPSMFPSNISGFQKRTEWPIAAHIKYFDSDTNLAQQNGGPYPFILEPITKGGENGALSLNQDLWELLIGENKQLWHLTLLEHDWLDIMTEHLKCLQTDPELGRRWLLMWGAAALRHNVPVQYCMAYPRHYLQSIEVTAVTQIRATDDYHPLSPARFSTLPLQYRIGDTAMLAHALALAPSKDTFRSNSQNQNCSLEHGDGPELFVELQTVVAVLSTGPVGPGDAIGALNTSLVMRTCMTDGRLLQPSVPPRPLDATFRYRAFDVAGYGPQGNVWDSWTAVGQLAWHHLFAVDMVAAYALYPKTLIRQLESTNSHLIFEQLNFASARPFDQNNPIMIPKGGIAQFVLFHTAPIFSNGFAVLGEAGKIVPVSKQRFRSISEVDTGISLELVGAPGEVVTVMIWQRSTGQATGLSCTLGVSSLVTMVVPAPGVQHSCLSDI